MNKAADDRRRLKALRDSGAIDQAQYDREVARLDEDDDGPSMSIGARVLTFVIGMALLITVPYFIASVRSSGSDTAAPQAAAVNTVETSDASTNIGAVQRPSPDYQALCIYSGLTPLGTRLSTMADLLAQQGRSIIWEPAGDDWIMRTSWRDQLTGADHEEAFEFQRRHGAKPAHTCNRPIGEVLLSRMARDGVELTEPDPSFASFFYKDMGPATGGGPTTVPEDADAAIREIPIVAKYIALNDRCRGGSGDDDATMRACEERDTLLPEVERQGYCWGNASDQSEADRHWQRCSSR